MTNLDLMDKVEDLITDYFNENPDEKVISEAYQVGSMCEENFYVENKED